MQSFFSSSAKPARPALVSTVTVKKKVVPKPGSSGSSGPLITKASSSTLLSKPKAPTSSSSSSAKRPSPGLKSGAASAALSPRSAGSGSGSPAARRRKPTAPQRVLPESSDDESSDDALAPKRRRVNGTAASGSTPDAAGEGDVGRSVFCPTRTDERGEWGRGYAGFVPCEHAVRGTVVGWAGGSKEGKEGEREKYQAYFPQEGFENTEPLPTVELRYPSGAKEKFVLLTPISSREYNPMSELRSALRFILKHYIPPSHAHIFGSLDTTGDIHSSVPSRIHSPAPGSLTTPPPDGMSPQPHTPQETIGDALRRALAPNRRDGPGLLKAVERLNSALDEIASDGTMAAWLSSPQYRMSRRDWSGFVEFVHDQSYSRVVAPFSDQLEHHPKHPDEVAAAISEKEDAYGELRHNFMSKVIEQTDLGPDSVFVDLGSGVGNCVVQAALQAGSRSYGFELLPVPSRCARLQLRECQRRWAIWCLDGNTKAEVHEGDFRRHPSVVKSLRDADVVLVNNEVFPSSLNHELTDLFLELKEGATIVSLKPFVPDGFRLNDGNYNSFAAILRQTSHTYYPNWVSWKGDSGKYYVQVVDRSIRARYDEEQKQRRRRE
ncbi:Histone-lysine N-methyltransferase, H3 lysine-79 specific [Vanrija pseudolonga]|uniref:Histone-lysine N-methyltransferase, H3 lysine-79 specific n=1 Tax=Vanrija pseudolonga TaxID=143232 RepID=A0AAF0Y304_9TREE|nr:Histone-lysine N-methyltransferase, H3 lysine-79 specific [Vanrija pseudolonga]